MSEVYPIIDVIAAAQAVFEDQGFIKSKGGHRDANGNDVLDNRTATLMLLNGYVHPHSCKQLTVTESHKLLAQEILNHFLQEATMRKLADTQTEFEATLSKALMSPMVPIGRELSMIASLPNSFMIAKRRDTLAKFYEENRYIGSFVGNVNERIEITADIVDCKWIPNHYVYLVIGKTDSNQLIKFFLSNTENADAATDIAVLIRGRTICFAGNVKSQKISEYTHCYETMFNRIQFKSY